MTKNVIMDTVFVTVSALVLSACSTAFEAHKPIFTGDPDVSKVAIARTGQIEGVPPLGFKSLTFEPLARFSPKFADREGKVTKVTVLADDHPLTTVREITDVGTRAIVVEKVTLGDLFPLLSLEIRAFNPKGKFDGDIEALKKNGERFERKQVTQISNVQGKLFPLKIGNRLTVDVTYLQKQGSKTPGVSDQELPVKFQFEVKEIYDEYEDSKPKVEGPIYLVQRRRLYPADGPTDVDFLYSEQLGWPVLYRYYDKFGRQMMESALISWEPK